MRHTTCKTGQETTGNTERAVCNMQRLATHNMQQMRCDVGPGDRQRTPCDMGHWDGQQATDHVQRRTCDMQQRKGTWTRSNGQRAAEDHWKVCNRQLTTCNPHRGKADRRHATCDGENATNDSQLPTDNFQTTCGMQRAICSEQRTGNAQQVTCARLKATCSGQHRRATQHAACSMQRATCGRNFGKDH